MKVFCTLACAACIACCLPCKAQTNLCPSKSVSFFLPPLTLRGEHAPDTAKPEPDSSKPAAITAAPVQPTEIDLVFGNDEFSSRVVKRGEFYLVRPEQPPSDPMARFVDDIFRPEVVHVGKIPVTCSVITAIKRKNPLCLLNPQFFQASW